MTTDNILIEDCIGIAKRNIVFRMVKGMSFKTVEIVTMIQRNGYLDSQYEVYHNHKLVLTSKSLSVVVEAYNKIKIN